MSRRLVGVTMVLFYLSIGLAAVVILILQASTKSLGLPLVISSVGLVVVTVAISSIMLPEFTGAPWVPMSSEKVGKILAMCQLKESEVLYDLGSGDGRIVIAAAKDFGARAVGIEIDPFRVFYSRLKIFQLRLRGRAKILRGNFFNFDLGQADVLVLFLLQKTNDKLRGKLERELTKPDCRVISVVFRFEGWELVREDSEEMIYVYRPHPALKESS